MTETAQQSLIVGILLAGGFSRRFGQQDKLLHPLAHGLSVAETAARAFIDALPNAVSVVRQENTVLQQALVTQGYRVTPCEAKATEMADSLKLGVRAAQAAFPDATGFVIALADMPFIQPVTIRKVADQLKFSAIVQPTCNGQRGHPVGFASRFAQALLAVSGDQGAREVLRAHQHEVCLLACDDEGILQDIDTPADLP
ncbi:MAG: nucleotidyltransferase family protein [Methylophilus sp.]|uniref:nucleotidyltransferase family protein n=1 Tax=Methylophilus sp. TaxID=29541 RepID=UPI003FA05710